MKGPARIAWPALLAVQVACGYAHKNFNQAGAALASPGDFVIQVDDYGSFWDPEVPARALEAIARSARTTNTIVVVAVHGWHHNADPDDENALGFASALQDIRKKLDDRADGKPGFYRRSREILTGSGDVNVFGIYVGWRGTSLPMPFAYLTFWDRKNAAERVGRGDLREFLLRLNALYRATYRDRGPSSPYVGMAAIGHSFGAQVLFTAISSTLEQELIAVTDVTLDPDEPRQPLARPLEGFGDIVVLVNPALEAFQFERIRRLDAKLAYDRRQPPLLLVLSADTDSSRHVWFPVGRWADAIFRAPMRDEQSDLWSTALGEYEPQRTHTINFLPEQPSSAAAFYIGNAPRRPCDIVNFDLTDMPTIAHVRLEPIPGRRHPHSPFIVAYGGQELIRGHSGIFERTLHAFINDYIGITRGKRLLLRDPRMQRCPAPAPGDPAITLREREALARQ
ncbi:MAG TPA: hypothetical protein VFP65_20135 [Anaeromyxobacteraceae bacterium]|nr:hypothetical protein [Anaeromyxobacteraceae bacterium]